VQIEQLKIKKKLKPESEVRSEEARKLIKFSIPDEELDPDMLADVGDTDD